MSVLPVAVPLTVAYSYLIERGTTDRPNGPQHTEENPMNATTATIFMTTNKGADIEVVTADGDSIYGTALSVNSKGVNVKDDNGKTRSVSLARVAELVLIEDDTFGSDDDADDEAAALITRLDEVADEISDGATTAEVAAALSDVMDREITPKELRVHLRALGLGVGKGRKYALSAGELRAVHNVITQADLDATAAANA